MRQRYLAIASLVTASLTLWACSPKASAPPQAAPTSADTYQSFVGAADRSAEDRAMDTGRHPVEFLEFLQLQPGMRVGELFAGTGYTTELLARAVAPEGVVYGQNTKMALEKFAEGPWSERLKKPVMSHVVREDRDLDSPFPADVTGLDAVVCVLNYHDAVWMNVDRDKMNRAVHDALKPGGAYVLADNSGRTGTGLTEVQTLHRIEQSVVIEEVLKAGFALAGEADFLRNPQDARDWNASPKASPEKRGTADRFVLRFVRK